MEEKKGISAKVWIGIIVIILVVGCVIGISANIYYNSPGDVVYDEMDGGEVSLRYTDDKNLFSIVDFTPLSDVSGMALESADRFFDFIVATDISYANSISYNVVVVKNGDLSNVPNEYIKLYLEEEKSGSFVSVVEPTVFSPNVKDGTYDGEAMTIFQMNKKKSGKDNYRLRMWISEEAQLTAEQINNFTINIEVEGEAN